MEQKRLLLFLIGCMGTRYGLTYYAKTHPESLPLMGKGALLLALGIAVIHFMGLRKTGAETFGEPIWWDNLRPLHAMMWATFGYMAIKGNPDSWKVLLADTTFGLGAWAMHHKLIGA